MKRKELDNRCRYIRDITGINNKVSDEDKKWLIDNVFKFHHNWYNKSLDMDYIYVGKNMYATVSYWIKYKDGTSDDISWKQSIKDRFNKNTRR